MAKRRVDSLSLGDITMTRKEKQAIKERIKALSGIIKTGENGSQIIKSIRTI